MSERRIIIGPAIMAGTVPNDTYNKSRVVTYVKDGYKKLNWIRICRIPLGNPLKGNGAIPGHYWVEIIHDDENDIDDHVKKARMAKQKEGKINKLGNIKSANGFRESYGWYPVSLPISISWSSFEIKEKGVLNGASDSRIAKDANKFRDHKTEREAGRKTMNNNLSKYAFDPHQYQRFKEKDINMISNPYLPPGDNRTKETIIQQIRNFASTFHSKHSAIWSWDNDSYYEVNCHTFLFLLLGEVGLADPIIANDQDKHFRCYFNDINCFFNLILASKAIEARRKILTNLKNLSLRLVNKN